MSNAYSRTYCDKLFNFFHFLIYSFLDERDKLFRDVEADWKKREKRDRQEIQLNDNEDDDDDDDNTEELEECIVKVSISKNHSFIRKIKFIINLIR